jgi:parallel beta-helix repeat protein
LCSAQTYYVSSRGNDQADGKTLSTPWRTLTQLRTVLNGLKPGDSVLFERGSIFRGNLTIQSSGVTGKEIYFGAYGKGANPILKGSVQQKSWKLMDNNIWFAVCDSCRETPANLFINNKVQPIGRFPNKGYRMLNAQNKGTFVDSSIGLHEADWMGGELVVKSKPYILDRFPIQSYRNAVFEVATPGNYKPEEKSPYFIQNHFATLDAPGEWCFSSSEKKLFVYATKFPPSRYPVEISYISTGLVIIDQHDIVVENLSFVNYQTTAVQITRTSNITFRQNVIAFPGINGLEVKASTHPVVEDNLITDVSNDAVVWENNENGIFAHNKVLRTAVVPGRGKSGNGAYIAFYAIGDTKEKQNVIQNNTIDSTGYSAIDFRNGSTLIKNNIISNFCLLKDDGGGIYTWTNAYGKNVIEGNIILGRKLPNSVRYTEKNYSYGIYIDDRSRDIVVHNNTIAYCSVAGILVHNASGLNIYENKLLGNGENTFHKEKGQLVLRRDKLAPGSEWDIQNVSFTNNKVVSTQEDQYSVYLNFYKEQSAAVGSFDKNQYSVVRAMSFGARDRTVTSDKNVCTSPNELQLKDWQQLTGGDRNSVVQVIANPYLNAGVNLVQNGDMTSGTQRWMIWPSEARLKQDPQTLKTPSLKVDVLSDTTGVLLYYAGLHFKPSTLYRLTFSVKSDSPSDMEFVSMMATAPYKALCDYRCLKIDASEKTFSFYFLINNVREEARLNFKGNTSFWIDNVTLQEMRLKSDKEQTIKLIYNDSEKEKTFSLAGLPSVRLSPFNSEILVRK